MTTEELLYERIAEHDPVFLDFEGDEENDVVAEAEEILRQACYSRWKRAARKMGEYMLLGGLYAASCGRGYIPNPGVLRGDEELWRRLGAD